MKTSQNSNGLWVWQLGIIALGKWGWGSFQDWKTQSPHARRKLVFQLFLLLLVLWILPAAIAPLRLALTRAVYPEPDAILVLGGGIYRDKFAIDLLERHPDLPLWVSSGSFPVYDSIVISPYQIYLDNQATDTVTNFTTMVKPLQRHGVKHVYLITSDFHMRRSTAIATVVLGSHGIAFTPLSVPSQSPLESRTRVARDIGRSILWVMTGRTGASLNPDYEAELKSRENMQRLLDKTLGNFKGRH